MSGGKLPEGWVVTNLQNIANWGSGGTPSRSHDEYYNGNIPWIKTGDLGPKLITEASEYITDAGVKNSSAKYFPKGSVAIAMYGATIGKTSILGIDATTNQACAVGSPIEGITSSIFLYYFLLNEKNAFIKKGKGGAQPNISQAVIKEHPLSLPPYAEQKIIAEKLDTLLAQVDSIKALLECAFNKLEMFKRVVMDFAVKGDLTKEWRNKNEINEWKITHWENILLDKKDSFRRGPFGGALKKDIFVERGYKVYEQYCPINDDCSFSRYYITEEKFHEMNKFEVHAGDFLISGAGSIGKITLVPEGCEKGIINQALLRVRINNEIYDKRFFLTLFRSPMFQKVIIENSTGSAMQNLKSVKELKQIPVPLPCLSEQHEIVRRVEQLFAYADTIEKQVNSALTRVNNLTQSILAKAFLGELTAQWRAENPSLISGENSATALLERIKAERAASSGKKSSRKKA
ncbi:restriction endonuclease subunit S [Enterobacter hormaechei]|uniref:restriction endonuclease subunit S n=1 Tax=Enterobacter TaxID=547 RepID=UPI0005F8A95D|nr:MULTISPECIES: restriction endonuclease subunit S [Enterobacter]UTA18495.1 restriction endonuclease subunit S [Enterobacter cloacae]EKS6535186.1 restriction endonuclease subunit S [Enterobacter hormaechei]EKS6538857.1 restriction endonuclease subunit S [Enterobacter hormaechei]EKS6541158.1 restriction endonuclease subunit S [Enterobacter hormaechei]EKS6547219.1 restriction endonuclease subunit S [Enterobacter hormaechei]